MGTHQGTHPSTHHRDSSQGLGATGTHPETHPWGPTPWNSPGDSPTGTHPGLTHGDPPQGPHPRDLTHRDSPRSVLGPASRCLNLSSAGRASPGLKAELLRAIDPGAPPSTTVAACGRDWDLCKGAASLALPARRGAGGEERRLPGLGPQPGAHREASRPPHRVCHGTVVPPALTELRRAAC